MSRRLVVLVAIAAVAIAGGWWLRTTRVARAPNVASSAPAAAGTAPAGDTRKITATLYYISEDGMALVGVKREVPFGESVVDQGRQIVAAQLGSAPPPFASAIPANVTLRGFYVTERGDAFVDLSPEARTGHTGGALDELFTVYAIVNALTTNLPAVSRVQILIDGKEVDTLAGHVDLRHPLQKNLKWVRGDQG
ncbi:MAG TPA: GerMN domain-containing protein [Vicinamibacterales bacterium]|nr:GerMN domain-containing protein [Vicinamibacterales bacterium]